MSVRLQKILAMAGVASRRAAEELIRQGRVSVNGRTVLELGTKADPARDEVRVDGSRLKGPEQLRYLLLHKPAGVVTTRSDPGRRPTVMHLLAGVREYVYPVGRLDYDSEGLLLLTNDGDLAARLTHPRHGVEREYHAWVLGVPDERDLERLRRGVPIDGRRTQPADVAIVHMGRGKRATQTMLAVVLREGRNRQVRKMFEAVGHPVDSLTRVRFGPLTDSRLKPGQFRDLTPEEVRRLKKAAQSGAPAAADTTRPTRSTGRGPGTPAPPASRPPKRGRRPRDEDRHGGD
jgi:23S rRNA pseudouridine2605 synthase